MSMQGNSDVTLDDKAVAAHQAIGALLHGASRTTSIAALATAINDEVFTVVEECDNMKSFMGMVTIIEDLYNKKVGARLDPDAQARLLETLEVQINDRRTAFCDALEPHMTNLKEYANAPYGSEHKADVADNMQNVISYACTEFWRLSLCLLSVDERTKNPLHVSRREFIKNAAGHDNLTFVTAIIPHINAQMNFVPSSST